MMKTTRMSAKYKKFGIESILNEISFNSEHVLPHLLPILIA